MRTVGSGVLRRLVRLESVIGVSEDDWVDVVMWDARGGGIFGHVHYRFSKSRMENQSVPCSDEEEVQIMRGNCEDDGHRFFGRGDELIGVIVYSLSYLNLKPRNMVFGDRYRYTPGDQNKATLINEEILRISRVVVHPRFRGIGLGAHLVKETLPKVGARVVEVLAVMAKYDPFFEKAGMLRVDYGRDEATIDKKIRGFLEERRFDFKSAKSKAYCRSFFSELDDAAKRILAEYLKEFVEQPFVKVKTVTSELLGRAFSSEGVYLYRVNGSNRRAPDSCRLS